MLHKAHETIEDALGAAEAGVPVDMIQIDVTRTWEILGEIIGDTVQEGLINELFSRFALENKKCIEKEGRIKRTCKEI